jgi:hypothetical protein
MLTFNHLLRDDGVDPALVKLVRHHERRQGRTPHHLWLANDGQFELYQRIERRPVFEGTRRLASFVVTPLEDTLFVGIEGIGKAADGMSDPLSGKGVSGFNLYSLSPVQPLADYRGRLIVEWGLGYRSWVQRAQRNEKVVLELRRTSSEPSFPGFLDFCERLSDLVTVPPSWRTALSSVSGVYLLTCPKRANSTSGPRKEWEGFGDVGRSM